MPRLSVLREPFTVRKYDLRNRARNQAPGWASSSLMSFALAERRSVWGVSDGLVERMSLQEFQVGLFASLPARGRLKSVDVPADQFRKGGCALPQTGQLGRILERHFAVPGPARCGGAVGESPAFPVQDLSLATPPDDGRVARGTVALFASFDR